MNNRVLRIASAASILLVLTGCAPATRPAEQSPRPTATEETTTPSSASSPADPSLTDLSLADGASLPIGSEINLGDSLRADAGWTELPSEAPGRWAYQNVAGTCIAKFRQGALGAGPDMDDREASDALIAVKSGLSAAEVAPLLNDGYFPRYGNASARIAHRQFSLTINGSGTFIAVRAFVAVDYSVEVVITCEGTNVSAVASEVLGKTAVQVLEP